jgi:hypothetical protein
MCPICQAHDGKPCEIRERPDHRLVCSCGRHSWPDAAALQETYRRLSLTTVRTAHIWTQGM